MDIYEDIRTNLLMGHAKEVKALVEKALALKYPPESILKDGLILGIEMLSYKFRTCDVSVPEALMSTRALNMGLKAVTPYLKVSQRPKSCRAIIGTVEGDLHDIGKNLVKTYVSTLDIEVIDLGVDVSKEEFAEAVRKWQPQLVMISSLLLTTVDEIKEVIQELKKLQKPFLVLVNSASPHGQKARQTAEGIREKYKAAALPVNCAQLSEEDIRRIMEKVLYEFPVTMVEFYMPKWVEMLPADHKMKADLIARIRELMSGINVIRDVAERPVGLQGDYIRRCLVENINMADGCVRVVLDMEDRYYYEMISDLTQEPVSGEYQLMRLLKEMAEMKREYARVLNAMQSVRTKGYGVVLPQRDEICLEKPEVIRHGNKYGVKIKAESPSLHFIRANVVTEIAPIVGTEQQARDLIGYIDENGKNDGIWETNIFGKTVEQLVNDGIRAKISMIGEESQQKLQDTMQKIVNDSTGGMVCIII